MSATHHFFFATAARSAVLRFRRLAFTFLLWFRHRSRACRRRWLLRRLHGRTRQQIAYKASAAPARRGGWSADAGAASVVRQESTSRRTMLYYHYCSLSRLSRNEELLLVKSRVSTDLYVLATDRPRKAQCRPVRRKLEYNTVIELALSVRHCVGRFTHSLTVGRFTHSSSTDCGVQ